MSNHICRAGRLLHRSFTQRLRRGCRTWLHVAALGLVSGLALSPVAHGEEIDCKVILCLAGGFPGGCEDAHGYMMDRLTATPPKPPYGICETQNLDGTSGVYDGAESAMFTRSAPPVCIETRTYQGEDAGTQCVRWSTTHNATIRIAVDAGVGAPPFTNEYVWRSWTVETAIDPETETAR